MPTEEADRARTRRPSRDGSGTRVYFTADELERLAFFGHVPSAHAKIVQALKRVTASA